MTGRGEDLQARSIEPPEKYTGKGEELYATRPVPSRETIVVSSPGEAFSLTEGLLMGDPSSIGFVSRRQ